MDCNNRPSYLTTLPPELIIKILAEVDYQTLIVCKKVCSFLYELIKGTVILQYKIELGVAGMEDGCANNISVSERFERLRTHQEAWSDLEWTRETWFPMLSQGVWEFCGGVWAEKRGFSGLSFLQLPSTIRGIDQKAWTIEDTGIFIRDFTLDPSQDLLVIIQMPERDAMGIFLPLKIHLRTLSSGEPHPQGPETAYLSYSGFNPQGRYSIQICGHYLGILFQGPEDEGNSKSELVIWDWTTGSIEMGRYNAEIQTFLLLTESLVMIGNVKLHRTGNVGALYLEPVLEVVPFRKTPDCDIRGSYNFHCPALRPAVFVSDLLIRSDPASSWMPQLHPDIPFFVERQKRLLVVTFSTTAFYQHVPIALFVPLQTLLDAIERSDAGGREFSWEDWGTKGTRMLSLRTSPCWVCYVYGMKFVTRVDEETFRVYDFNPVSLKVQQLRSSIGDNAVFDVGPTTLSLPRIFRTDIITWLPYVIRTASVPDRVVEQPEMVPMLGEDGVIFVGSRDRGTRFNCLLAF